MVVAERRQLPVRLEIRPRVVRTGSNNHPESGSRRAPAFFLNKANHAMKPKKDATNLQKQALSRCPPSTQPPALCGKDCDSDGQCSRCPVWKELSENKTYRTQAGIEIPTMTGRKENLLFQFVPSNGKVRVWRRRESLDFSFGEDECRALCRRFQQGLRERKDFKNRGTGYFTDPAWPNPCLGRFNTPYAAAVIRYVLRLLVDM